MQVRGVDGRSDSSFVFAASICTLFQLCAYTSQFPSPRAAIRPTINGRCHPIWLRYDLPEQHRSSFHCTNRKSASPRCLRECRESFCRSRFDVDPQRYGEDPIPECGEADPSRTAVDELLLQEAFNLHKPILAICHGTQSLNVWLNGSLVQDLKTAVDHRPGRDVLEAHPVQITPESRLAGLVPPGSAAEPQVNSSHHQAIRVAGDSLLVSAVSAADGVVEAVELDSRDHFVLGVQWHPERSYSQSALSRAIFAAFVQAAGVWQPRRIEESVAPG